MIMFCVFLYIWKDWSENTSIYNWLNIRYIMGGKFFYPVRFMAVGFMAVQDHKDISI